MPDKEKPVSLTELINEAPKKKPNRIYDYFLKGKSEEEIREWRKGAAEKRKATNQKKREAADDLRRRAEEMVPEILAHQIISEDMSSENWIPKQETIDKVKSLISRNLSMEEMRRKYFSGMSDNTWHKLQKFVFKSQITQSEDLGADIMRVKQASITRLKRQLRDIKKQKKIYTEETKKRLIPAYLLQMERDTEKELMQIELDVSKTLFQVGAVGEKSKSPSLHLHLSTPRPSKEKPVVEAVAVVVDELA